ncbi:MAG: phenylalanine--tRNA ligase beta subunit [Candidatus Binatia bacterium]|nr:MAG: phenylalanine--tRNA ligase beta subunit [Candidatus Binatia bacterium]
MKVTLRWLRELLEGDLEPDEIVDRLTGAGLEVEAVEEIGRELEAVRVAEAVRLEPHPGSARWEVCFLRDGGPELCRVVRPAGELGVGRRFALARAGTRLPTGSTVEARDVEGMRSEGIVCRAADLGFGDEGGGPLELPEDAPVGTSLAELFGLRDTVLEVSVTPNRGDCLSVLGLARELCALTGARLRKRRSVAAARPPGPGPFSVRIDAADACRRYAARLVEEVSVGPAPLWMQWRLAAVGLRPVNNVVDVTNYVMVELGQPLHAFDYDRLPRPSIVVRYAGARSAFSGLDGREYVLEPEDLAITTGEEIVALAGILGGLRTAIEPSTRRILLESAWFDPVRVRKTAKRLGLLTESSYRFERGVDIGGTVTALERAVELLGREIPGSHPTGAAVDVQVGDTRPAPVRVRLEKVRDLLGLPVDRGRVVGILRRLGVTVQGGGRGALSVVPPTYRSDLTREIDFVEEVARVAGYEEIPTSLPRCEITRGEDTPLRRKVKELRALLAHLGWNETMTLPFASESTNARFRFLAPGGALPVRLRNPLVAEQNEMRMSLVPGLLDAVRWNLHQGESSVALFAFGRVYWAGSDGFHERTQLGGVLRGEIPAEGLVGRRAAEFADLKGTTELVCGPALGSLRWEAATCAALHPGLGAEIRAGSRLVGVLGAVHPLVLEAWEIPHPCWVFEIDVEFLVGYGRERRFRDLPRFPAVVRDFAIVVPDRFASAEVLEFVRSRSHPWVEDVRVFDEYRGAPVPAGKKGLAYSVTYRSEERTLTDEEVNAVHEELVRALTERFGVELRR